jgi:hypothetical protein
MYKKKPEPHRRVKWNGCGAEIQGGKSERAHQTFERIKTKKSFKPAISASRDVSIIVITWPVLRWLDKHCSPVKVGLVQRCVHQHIDRLKCAAGSTRNGRKSPRE